MDPAAPVQSDVFEEHRRLMFGVAYRMLGIVQEAEDVVQDAYLRFRGAGQPPEHPKAYFVTVVTRLCLDRLKSARMQREEYIGPWLPEPLVMQGDAVATPEQAVALEDDVSMAFLVLLERLTPSERAVFLLREVFDYDYADIAQVVQKSEAACRQTFRRARARVAEGERRFVTSKDEVRAITARFVQAVSEGDMAGLMELLSHDVVVYADGGGKAAAARKPVHGAEKVMRYLVGVTKKELITAFEFPLVNGTPGLLLRGNRGRVHTVMTLHVEDGQVVAMYVMRNPDKLVQARKDQPPP